MLLPLDEPRMRPALPRPGVVNLPQQVGARTVTSSFPRRGSLSAPKCEAPVKEVLVLPL